MAPLLLALLALLLGLTLTLSRLLLERWLRRRVRRGLHLPPGTMGWPVVGETPGFYSGEPGAFFQGKQKRYGDIFKTHVLGRPAVMVASPDAIKFVMTHDELFVPTFPATKERLLGRHALFFHSGAYHGAVRRVAVAAFGPDGVRAAVPDVEAAAVRCLAGMEAQGEVPNAFRTLKDFTFDVAALFVLGPRVPEAQMRELKDAYYQLDSGYNSFPLNFPGTKFYKSMQARRRMQRVLQQIMEQGDGSQHADLLKRFLHTDTETDAASTGGTKFTREQIMDNLIGLIFAAHGTTASILTWLVKYLGEHPDVLRAVTAEQQGLVDAKPPGHTGLTWLDTRNAPVTTRVILETMRAASILSFTFRQAVQDVEYKGYIIPRGWRVMPLFRNMHYNSTLFTDPQKFDPSRFELQAAPKPNSYMPFGQGVHSCLGSEVAKLEMHVFIHHLTTKYRWQTLAGEGVTYSPFPVPKDGLPLRLFRRDKTVPSLSEGGVACG